MDKHIMAQACPQCGGTEYYCAEEAERELAECRDDRAEALAAVDALIEERDAYDADLEECREKLAAMEAREQSVAAWQAWSGELAEALERVATSKWTVSSIVPLLDRDRYPELALNAALEQARAEERERAKLLFDAVKQAMDEEYELSERTCDALWEAWCAYGEELRHEDNV